MLYGVFLGISYFCRSSATLLIYCVMSWILPPYHKAMRFLGRLIDPVLSPIRTLLFRIFPRLPIDLSALAAFFVLDLIGRLLPAAFLPAGLICGRIGRAKSG